MAELSVSERICQTVLDLAEHHTGFDFVSATVGAFANATNCESAFLGILKNSQDGVILGFCCIEQGAPLPPFEYSMHDTPCALTYDGQELRIPCDVHKNFAGEAGTGLESFIGLPISHPSKGVVAHFAAYDSTPEKFSSIDDVAVKTLRSLISREVMALSRKDDKAPLDLISEAEKWRTLALTDPMTLLGNRRALEEYWQSEAIQALSGGIGAVAILDIDHFKSINDARGHDVGDLCLQYLALTLRNIEINNDVKSYRLGGEEFCLVAERGTVGELAELLQEELTAFKSGLDAAPDLPFFTVSGGLAEINKRTLSEALKEADLKLYQAKNDGRDRLVF